MILPVRQIHLPLEEEGAFFAGPFDITPDNESDYGDGKKYSNDPAKISKVSQKNHPNSSKLSGAANTGDVTGIASLVILFILSGALLIAAGLTKRKTSR